MSPFRVNTHFACFSSKLSSSIGLSRCAGILTPCELAKCTCKPLFCTNDVRHVIHLYVAFSYSASFSLGRYLCWFGLSENFAIQKETFKRHQTYAAFTRAGNSPKSASTSSNSKTWCSTRWFFNECWEEKNYWVPSFKAHALYLFIRISTKVAIDEVRILLVSFCLMDP